MSTFDDHANLGYSLVTVAPAPAGSGGSLTVSSSATFPTAPFNCTVWPPNVLPLQSNAEIVRVTAIVGDVLSITRAQEGTSAKSIAVGWQVANTITVKVIDDIQDAVTSTEGDVSTLQGQVSTILSTAVFDGDAAGGDLDGTYPNPTLDAIVIAAGPIGSATVVPVVTIDTKGRVTVLGQATITGTPPGGAAGGVLSGTYPNPGFAVDMATQAELNALAAAAVLDGDAAGGDLTGTYPSPTLAAIGSATGPIGDATHAPVVTIDAKGRVTALTSVLVTGVVPGGAAGGVLAGTYPNPSFAVDMATQAELDAATKFATPADLTAAGITMTMTAGEALTFGDPVYVKNDGKAWKADANGTATYPAIGLAAASVSANASVSILVHGEARSDSAWNWTVGGIIYLSTSAGLTQTQPSATNDVIQVLGVALSADVMYVSPDLFYITHV